VAAASTLLLGCGVPATHVPPLRVAAGSSPPALAAPEIEAAPPLDPVAEQPVTTSVIVVAIDGVRWQEVFRGVDRELLQKTGASGVAVTDAATLLPNLHALARDGVAIGAPGIGAPIVASGPNFASLPGYMEMLAGRATGCEKNTCPAIEESTLLDQCRSLPGVSAADVGMIASWEKLDRAAALHPEEMVISAGRHGGITRQRLEDDPVARKLLEEGAAARPFPGGNDYRPDRLTAPLALRYLETARPRCAFIGLGDPDEYAHAGDYRGYLESLREADRVLGRIRDVVASWGPRGRETTVVVTADHGRAHDFNHHGRLAPESARVWLIAAGGAVPARGMVAAEEERRLADIAPTLRALLGLPADVREGGGQLLAEMLPSHAALPGSRVATRR
jgi:hypothetical protein